MRDAIDAWLRLAAERIHEQVDELTGLDRAIGDGDHGTNLDRGFAAVVATLDESPIQASGSDVDESAETLRTAGRQLISVVGGASGPLFGTAFLRASAALGKQANVEPAAAFVSALEAAIAGIGALGHATAGEKTMLDSLFPALTASRVALASGADSRVTLRAAADAAGAGAVATVPLLATKGRASYLGERSIGHQDPGATSAALLLRALADTVA
jgi:phosphoenolpyruvate---glycerone phosphotransferase subunit DhaL